MEPNKLDQPAPKANTLRKCPTGVRGFDDVTGGGLPLGRAALVCGGPGCGKTLFGLEFLVRGATRFDEPGVFISFEEREDELVENVRSLGFDLRDLEKRNLLRLDQVVIERNEIEESGAYNLEGLFVRIGFAIDEIGAKRVVLDTIESLFAGLPNASILRSELRRLFGWLKDKGVTAVITGERGDGQLTRQGLEEYVSDSVTLLDHRVINGLSTRRLRIVKYRGSMHGTNEYPFLITQSGMSVLPVTSLGLDHRASRERISSGIQHLDEMLGGQGYYRGSSILVSGMAGTGKTSLAARFAEAACRRGERVLYFGFEESAQQFYRNMASVGTHLEQYVGKGLFCHVASRPTLYGLEMHLVNIHDEIKAFKPAVVICDPLTALLDVGAAIDVKVTMTRLIDFLKASQITALFTNLAMDVVNLENTDLGISSLIDSWLKLMALEQGGERNRSLQIIKSRGMPHSNAIREFCMSEHGIDLVDVYVSPRGVLTGTERRNQILTEEQARQQRQTQDERTRHNLEQKRHALEAQIHALRAAFAATFEGVLATLTPPSGDSQPPPSPHGAGATREGPTENGANDVR